MIKVKRSQGTEGSQANLTGVLLEEIRTKAKRDAQVKTRVEKSTGSQGERRQGKPNLPTPPSPTSSLQIGAKINVCCLSHLSWYLVIPAAFNNNTG